MRTQLVAARTVAAELAKLATEDDLPARPGEEVSDPDDPDAVVFESGGLLPSAHATLAGPTFEERLQR